MEDVINLYSHLIDVDAKLINGRTFNFGFENLKVIEIAELIKKELSDLGVTINVTATTDNRDYHISSKKIIDVLGYKPVSSIAKEVKTLRKTLEGGMFSNIDAPQHYNMQVMKIDRNTQPYQHLSL